MIFNWMQWTRDGKEIPKIHPTQKPVSLLKKLIGIFTDVGDVVIDPVAGSGSTIRAAAEMRRNAYGFEIDRKFYREAKEKMLAPEELQQSTIDDIFIEARKIEQMTLAGVMA
jgi:site-specific DNA-methyltransferase (adenine-specific)